ncbi:MAG: hypothetical protein J5608_03195 [Alphaproteobacteria bacterium]|nr:hypothetical protein [Alphaproteobacteria bacterium]
MARFFARFQRVISVVLLTTAGLFSSFAFGAITYNTNNCISDINSDCDTTRRQCEAVSGKVFTGWYDDSGNYIEDLTTHNGNATAHCETGLFAVAIKTPANKQFTVKRAFNGTLNINWGDGNTEAYTINGAWTASKTHTYPNANTVYVIVFESASVTNYAGYSNYSTIVFDSGQTAILNIYGSLGALFPTYSSLSNPNPRFPSAFSGATNLVGPLPKNLFVGISGTASAMFSGTFNGCSSLSGYLSPTIFDPNITGVVASMTSNLFNGTALDTSCPAGTEETATSIAKNLLGSKVACSVCAANTYGLGGANLCTACPAGTSSPAGSVSASDCTSSSTCPNNMPSYNGTCLTSCPVLNYLKTGNGISIPIWGNKVTTRAIYVKYNNSICYVPLETGGGTNTINIQYGNDRYHAIVIQ